MKRSEKKAEPRRAARAAFPWLLLLAVLGFAESARLPVISAQQGVVAGDLGAEQEGGPRESTNDREPDGGFPVVARRVRFPDEVARHLDEGGGWLPVSIELETTASETVTVEIVGEVYPANDPVPIFETRRTVDVSPGAPKRTWIYLLAEHGVAIQSARIELRKGERRVGLVAGATITLSAFEPRPFVVLAAGGGAGSAPWNGSLPGANVVSDGFLFCEEADLPDSSLGYRSFDLVVLRGTAPERWTPEQIEALREHVALGGFAVFACDASASLETSVGTFARELLGGAASDSVEVDREFRPGSLFVGASPDVVIDQTGFHLERSVSGLIPRWPAGGVIPWREDELAPDVRFVRVDPFADEASFLRRLVARDPIAADELAELPKAERRGLFDSGTTIYGEVAFGRGRAGALLIDERELPWTTGEGFRERLWTFITGGPKGSIASVNGRLEETRLRPEVVRRLLEEKERDVGFPIIVGIVLAYVVIAGPGLYLLLRRLRRLHGILWLEPLVVLVSLGGILGYGYLSKGLLTRVRTVDIIHQLPGSPLAIRESFLGLFAGGDGAYSVASSKGELLEPLWVHAAEAQRLALVLRPRDGSGSAQRIESFELRRWQRGSARSVAVERIGRGVSVRALEGEGGRTGWRVANDSPWPIVYGRLETQYGYLPVPEIATGAVIELWSPTSEKGDSKPARDRAGEDDETTAPPLDALVDGAIDRAADLATATGRAGVADVDRRVFFWGVLEREANDLRIDGTSTSSKKADLLVVHGELPELGGGRTGDGSEGEPRGGNR